ncbi:hypothetical protein SAMN05216464_11119 [Mucilaginibacter pineti]|uniref:Uncharacterized protein n=1 Tax=Mucilaginibacter pineti TaxID=1391627 RepID=A0A1G7H1Q1_9SPHI|nr:hypothetical protein [Mucilaginibacter pineti]SDE94337.1 hypothetical protein SAMN05216464_11119 [Mucilaginibacter pineti]
MKRLTLTLAALFCTALLFAQSATTSHTSTERTSISVSNSDNDYSLIAVFNSTKAEKIKMLLIQALGKPTNEADGLAIWNSKSTYTVSLKPEKVIIDLNKDKSTGALIKTFERLGDEIKKTLDPPKTPTPPSAN